MNPLDPSPIDPALLDDKTFISQLVAKALSSGGLTLGFANSSRARTVRRRMYYIVQQMAEFDRQQVNQVEFKVRGRMIAILPKNTLSSTPVKEQQDAN